MKNRMIVAVLSALTVSTALSGQVDESERVKGLFRSQLHRGGGKARPDNTLEACLWCWGQGVAPEADARFTKDRVAIAFHDGTLKRVARGIDETMANRKLPDLNWSEIRDLDVGSYLGPEHSSVRISTMESIFAAMKGRPDRYLYLDEKGAPPDVMAQMARQFGVERQVCYTSPNYFKVREWSRKVPGGETMVWIGGGWHPKMTDKTVGVMNASLEEKLTVLATNDYEGVSQVQLHVFVDMNRKDDWFAPSTERLSVAIARLHARGIRVQAGVWGRYSERAEVFDRLWALGFDSFATDNSYEYLDWHRAVVSGGRRPVFNGKDLSGWYTWLKGRGKNVDPKGVFSVTNGVIHVTGEEFGGLVTEDEFSDYHLSLEYRFTGGDHFGGKIGWAPDSGILFHSTGSDGGFHGVWMESVELNLIKGATGDFWGVGVNGSDRIALSARVGGELLGGKYAIHDPNGTNVYTIVGNNRVCRFDIDRGWTDTTDVAVAGNEKPLGEWNRVDLHCVGGEVVAIFNGKVVNRGFDVKPRKGRIQLQSEGCPVEFRDIVIAPERDLPDIR